VRIIDPERETRKREYSGDHRPSFFGSASGIRRSQDSSCNRLSTIALRRDTISTKSRTQQGLMSMTFILNASLIHQSR
jgi:hypothetical protein